MPMIIVAGLFAGSFEAMRLKMRVNELTVLLDAIRSIKAAAVYTSGELKTVIDMNRDNEFLQIVGTLPEPISAWNSASDSFFQDNDDASLAKAFIAGYGKSDLDGLLSHIAMFEEKAEAHLRRAEEAATSKCRICTVLGLFLGIVTAIVVI